MMSMKKKIGIHYLKYTIKKEDSGQEVRSILYEKMKLTTRKIRDLKRNTQGILLNGEPVTVRKTVREGSILQVILNDSQGGCGQNHILPVSMHLCILYEDEDLLFVNKPAGMVCHPSKGHLTDTLCNGVRGYYDKTEQNAGIHLFGRLDKETSGIVGIAKNKVTSERMQTLRKQGLFQKEYLALVCGCPKELSGTIVLPMEEDRSEGILKMRKGSALSAKEAVTHYQTLRWGPGWGGIALCQVTIETGRTHQIRFHMASIGCPLLGDILYGDEFQNETKMKRTALHARKVTFPHPFTGEEISITAALPDDMKNAINVMKKGEKNASTRN